VISILAEPSTYTFTGTDGKAFSRFVERLLKIRKLFLLNNNARLLISSELFNTVVSSFNPKFYSAPAGSGPEPSRPVIRVLLGFLDQFSIKPKMEYRCAEDTVKYNPEFQWVGHVYQHHDTKLAWCDLLAQVSVVPVSHEDYCDEVIASEREDSCLDRD